MINADFYDQKDLINLGFKKVGCNVKLHKSCIVVGVENISIGNNVRIDGFTSIIAADHGKLTLGSNIHIASHCYIGAGFEIIMDDFSGLAYGVKVHSMSDDYSGNYLTNSTIPSEYKNNKSGLVYIGKHSIIGSNAVILPKVNIPIGCSIGAMSMVTKNLEEWGVYFGCPVKRIKNRSKKLLDLEKKFLENMKNNTEN